MSNDDSDDPMIERTPAQVRAYFERCRKAKREAFLKHAPLISAKLELMRLLKARGRLHS